jgi:hypothetical protein
MEYRSWRTNTGVILGALGGAILTAAQLLTPFPKYKIFAEVGGTLLATFGGSLAAYGIGYKIERKTEKPAEPVKEPVATPSGAPSGLPAGDIPVKPIGEQGCTRLVVLSLISLILAGFFYACSGMQMKAEDSVCAVEPQAKDSVICRVATEHGWTVEDIDTMLLDATVTAWAFDAVDRQQILDALDKIESYLVLNQIVVLNKVTGLVIEDAKKSAALSAVVSRRIKYIDVPEVATDYDIHLMLTAVAHQRQQFEALK